MRSGKACASRSPSACAGTEAGGEASQRKRRRHCFAAASMAASAERLASAGTRPLRNAANACQRSASASERLRSGSRASTSAARSQASAMRAGASVASSIAASRGCVPSASMRLPRAVSLPSRNASRRCNRSLPAASAPDGGGSTKRSSLLPQAASSSASAASSTCAISGLRCGSSRCDCGHSRYAKPSATRPARPARWSALACEIATLSSREKPLLGSKRGSRARPLSITTRTPGRVTDDSATLVASTTRRRPSGAACSTRDCCSMGRSPCKGSTSKTGSCVVGDWGIASSAPWMARARIGAGCPD